LYEGKGAKFHIQCKVDRIVPAEDNAALATGVVVNGQTIPADFVIMGVGVAPATEYLKASRWELEKDGGVKVQGISSGDVFAIGEWCAVVAC
jgi:NAD(P)H-nitrite reductase large subunit